MQSSYKIIFAFAFAFQEDASGSIQSYLSLRKIRLILPSLKRITLDSFKMLCTKMRLTERRFRIKSSISYQHGDGDYESRAAVSSEVRSPFVRPCAFIKMYESSNGNEVISSSRPSTASNMKLNTNRKHDGNENSNRTDAHGSQSSLDR